MHRTRAGVRATWSGDAGRSSGQWGSGGVARFGLFRVEHAADAAQEP